MSEPKIEWRIQFPGYYIGMSRGEESEIVTVYKIKSQSILAISYCYVLYMESECGVGDDNDQYIASFRYLDNAKSFAEIIEVTKSYLFDDIVNHLLWRTNTRLKDE
jgi:hypothetical protein